MENQKRTRDLERGQDNRKRVQETSKEDSIGDKEYKRLGKRTG